MNDNPIPLADKDHKYQGIFDLCIESLSDSGSKEIKRDTVTKKSEYALAGVTEYYILDETGQHTAFYVLRQPGVYRSLRPTAEGVIRSTGLPGFQFRLTDLYHRPRLATLADDPVYQGFILPEYQAAKKQVKQEQERAERYAAKLKELGISLD